MTTQDQETRVPAQGLPKFLHCVAFEAGKGRYRAICLDFSLVAESPVSMLDAQERLIGQITDYVSDVIQEGCPPHLLLRSVEAGERLQIRARLLWQDVRDLLGGLPLPPFRDGGERATWLQPTPC